MLSASNISMSERIPWNWGTLEDVNGTTIVDGGIADLFDGSLDAGLSIDENGVSRVGRVHTGSDEYGALYSSSSACFDWTHSSSGAYNRLLSERRAQSVVAFLIENEVADQRFQPVGYGEDKPLVPNDMNMQ